MQPVENVSNYPLPPLIEVVSGSVEIWIAGQVIAQGQRYEGYVKPFTRSRFIYTLQPFAPARSTPQRGGLHSVNGKEWRPIGM